MKIIGKNSAIAQTAEDIVSKGGVLALPTQARIHAIVSDSTADDANGTLQVETATAAGTIVGINQVETATVVGTIAADGEGDAKVVITSALVTGSPLEIAVAVANDDTAGDVATKIRAALNATPSITAHYTIGGSAAAVSLTTKVKAANDTTLNIAIDNDTCTGLTAAATSANTTAGHAGSGTAAVVITSAIMSGSPLTVNVLLAAGDTPAVWAGKVRDHLNTIATITDKYTVSGETDKIVLTAKLGAANDSTLNIALANGTCNGITTAASSANTTAGIAGTGAHVVEVSGITENLIEESEMVALNGTSAVNTTKKYLTVNMEVKRAGSGGKNAGNITATAATDGTVSCQIDADMNISEQAVYMVPKDKTARIKFCDISAVNSTEGAVTSVSLLKKKWDGVWVPVMKISLDASSPVWRDIDSGLLPLFESGSVFKFQAVASAGSSSVSVNFDIV